MSRSLKKDLFTLKLKDTKMLAKFEKANKEKKIINVKTWYRNLVIEPIMLGHSLSIHNGHKFITRTITPNMVGCKLGMFAPTRRLGSHGKAGTH